MPGTGLGQADGGAVPRAAGPLKHPTAVTATQGTSELPQTHELCWSNVGTHHEAASSKGGAAGCRVRAGGGAGVPHSWGSGWQNGQQLPGWHYHQLCYFHPSPRSILRTTIQGMPENATCLGHAPAEGAAEAAHLVSGRGHQQERREGPVPARSVRQGLGTQWPSDPTSECLIQHTRKPVCSPGHQAPRHGQHFSVR